jgi:hypothetical protein
MAALTEEQKRFALRGFAQLKTSPEIARAMQETFGLAVEPSRQQLSRYDLDSNAAAVSKENRAFFEAERKAFVEKTDQVAIVHSSWRLRELLELYRKNKNRSPVVAAKLLEQAAKESVWSGSAGGIQVPGKATPQERRQGVSRREKSRIAST